MAIISECQEDEQNETQTKASASPSSSAQASSFSASFDPSDPLGFLDKVFDFIAQESDFLGKETSEKDITSVVRAAKERKKKREEQIASEKKAKAEKRPKEEKDEEKKKEESGSRGNDFGISNYFCSLPWHCFFSSFT